MPMPDILPEDSGTIRCICGYDHDDNFTIQCERCNAWQHATCVNITDESAVPEQYLCPGCSGKLMEVDANKAREHQKLLRKRRLEHQRATNNTETQEENKVRVTRTRGPRKRQSIESDHPLAPSSGGSHCSGASASMTGDASYDSAADSSGGFGISPLTSSDKLPAPITFNPQYYSVQAAQNRWTSQAQAVWTEIQNSGNIDALPLPLSNKDYSSAHPIRIVRNEKSRNKWTFGLSAGGLVCASNCSPHKLVCEVTGDIMTREEYCSDPLNQFAKLGCPKLGVVFVPGQPLVVDSRKRGSNALFIQRSSYPNAYLTAREDKKGRLRLFVCTRKSVKAGTELTLGWHWASSHPIMEYLKDTHTKADISDNIREFLWLLGQHDIRDIAKARASPSTDEDWGYVKHQPYLTLSRSRIEKIAELVADDVNNECATEPKADTPEADTNPTDLNSDPGVALEANVWKSATQCIAPPPKKRMSLADYRRKRT